MTHLPVRLQNLDLCWSIFLFILLPVVPNTVTNVLSWPKFESYFFSFTKKSSFVLVKILIYPVLKKMFEVRICFIFLINLRTNILYYVFKCKAVHYWHIIRAILHVSYRKWSRVSNLKTLWNLFLIYKGFSLIYNGFSSIYKGLMFRYKMDCYVKSTAGVKTTRLYPSERSFSKLYILVYDK